jgi:hypothetical protein
MEEEEPIEEDEEEFEEQEESGTSEEKESADEDEHGVIEVMECPEYGADTSPTDTACPKCGIAFEVEGAEEELEEE